MKLRQIPEDFKVEEIQGFKISRTGKYKLYLLTKKNLESFALINYLAKMNNIPVSEFGIAGLKDKHAITKQYLTVPMRYNIKTLKEENFDIRFLGYIKKGIRAGDLRSNRFEITVRYIKKGFIEGIKQKALNIESIGVPNYFDSQRFGSVVFNEFIAKYLIKKDYEQAVKLFLTQYINSENNNIKEDKRLIIKNWKNLKELNIKTPLLKNIIDKYKKTNNWLETYKTIPSNLREMFIYAYQSYLWNECVKEILKTKVDKKRLYPVKYNIGELIFYKNLTNEELDNIPKKLSTIGPDLKDSEIDMFKELLEKEGVSIQDFDIKKETGNFFKSHEREIIVKPIQFKMSEFSTDELNNIENNNVFKVKLSFILSKGSYATLITKKLFNK